MPDSNASSSILENIEMSVTESALPHHAQKYIQEAEDRMARSGRKPGMIQNGFIPSDFGAVFHVLRIIAERKLATGSRFLEWGSGFGVVTALAAGLGFESYGIEIQADLVEASERLAGDFEIEADFALGTFLPPEASDLADLVGDYPWWSDPSANAYEELGLEIDDFDVIFAYPWPGEECIVDTLFQDHAAAGALLVTHHGVTGTRTRRKRVDGESE